MTQSSRLVGVVTVGEPIMVVLEYCEHGSLKSYLQANDISEAMKFQIAGDCAEGLLYLTQRGFVHRDVAARNVLLSSELRGKISDVSVFGNWI